MSNVKYPVEVDGCCKGDILQIKVGYHNYYCATYVVALSIIIFFVVAMDFTSPAIAGDEEAISGEIDSLRDEFRSIKNEYDCSADSKNVEHLRSAKGNSSVKIGGELFLDYIGTMYSGDDYDGAGYSGNWQLHNTNLRFDFNFDSDLRVQVKLDLSDSPYRTQSRVMEEALMIWDSVCGGPIGLFFGIGEVPYGQDRTLGIIQSYNHTEGDYSSEGPIILSAPYLDSVRRDNIIYHPGEIDRVVMAGFNYTWRDTLKVEFAFFQPDSYADQIGIYERLANDGDSGMESFAGRVWWNTPIDGLVAELSGVRKHVVRRGDNGLYGPDAVEDEYAVSLGFDWNVNAELEIFAEYQHGFDWGFIEGYNTDTVSAGVLYALTEKFTLGGMVEWLHISDRGEETDLNKFILHTKYTFRNGVYLIAEYGAELYNWDNALSNVFAVRSGIQF